MSPKAVLHHVNFKTVRMQQMIEWYGIVIGTTVTFQYPGGAWLTNDSANHRIALLTVPGLENDPEKIRHTGLHHTAYEYPSLDDLLDEYSRLKEHSITPGGCIDHGMTTSFYYVDPDGNAVELQVDNFGDWSRSTEFMRSAPEFAADPIGTPIDPEQLLAARDAGATPQELHERGYRGEFMPDGPIETLLPSPPVEA
jgi:catechol 2,3-dioxygenase